MRAPVYRKCITFQRNHILKDSNCKHKKNKIKATERKKEKDPFQYLKNPKAIVGEPAPSELLQSYSHPLLQQL